MIKTQLSTLSKPIKFVELDNVTIDDAPIDYGQFTIVDNGSLYYDNATLKKRQRLGGIRVESLDSSDPNESVMQDGDPSHSGITDWNNDGISDIYDVLDSSEGKYFNQGDIYVPVSTVNGSDHTRFTSTSKIMNKNGRMVTLSSPNALCAKTYFEENIKVTEDVGRLKPSESDTGYITVNSMGKSVVEVMKDILQVVKPSSITYPELSVKYTLYSSSASSITNGTAKLNYNTLSKTSPTIQVEKGTHIHHVKLDLTLSRGKYSYGPDTGVKAGSVHNYSCLGSLGNLSVSDSGSGSTYTYSQNVSPASVAEYIDEQVYPCQVTLTTSAGTNANNSIGDTASPVISIPAYTDDANCTVTANVVGYKRGYFMGGLSGVDGTALTYWNIRSLAYKASGAFSASTITVTVGSGSTIVVIAIPSGKKITKIENVTAGFPDVKDDFVKRTISVGGADATESSIGNYASDYDVYYYQPPTGAYVNSTVFKVSLSN